MDRKKSRTEFSVRYQKTGVVVTRPIVEQVMENKHGIDNPVQDLKVTKQKIDGSVIFDGNDVTEPRTIIVQNQDGVLALQEAPTLDDKGVLFANSLGLIDQDATNFFYDVGSGSLSVPSLLDASLTPGRIVFSTTAGELTDDAQLTYDPGTNVLAVSIIAADAITLTDLTTGRVLIAGVGGNIEDNANLLFDGTRLTSTVLAASSLAGNTGDWVKIDTDGVLIPTSPPIEIADQTILNLETVTITGSLATPTPGVYRVSFYFYVSTPDAAAGMIQLSLSWSDAAGARTFDSDILDLATGGYTQATVITYTNATTLDYATALTAGAFMGATYDVYITLERLSA